MINVNDAKEQIIASLPQLELETKPLIDSAYQILAEDVISNYDLPHFNNSAVDGYAINSETYTANKTYQVRLEIGAGSTFEGQLSEDEAIRIFTGAAVPDCVDTIIMQEYAKTENQHVQFDDQFVKTGSHIRKKGEQLKTGDLVLKRGTLLNPFTIGFLANLGLSEISVYKKPSIGMIISGSELVQVGEELKPGQIFESNGVMLRSALKSYGFHSTYECIGDNKSDLDDAFKRAISDHDVIIFTGGASVGDYDFTADIIEENDFELVFNRINQKPGKPMIYAKRNDKVAFGLPGNPRAAFVCFYEYVLPAIKSMMGATRPFLETITLPLKHDYQRKNDNKTYFLNASFDHEGVEIFNKQQSDMLKTTAISNCIAILKSNETMLKKGDMIEAHILPKS